MILRNIATLLQTPFLFVIRVYWGYLFVSTGLGKAQDFHATAQFFSSLHIWAPTFTAALVAAVETIGGISLILGLFSRFAALVLIIVMLGAYFTAGYESLLTAWKTHNLTPVFQESPFLYLYASAIVFLFGPGRLALDSFREPQPPKI